MSSPALAKQLSQLHVYHMSTNEDYFYQHPNSVLLGFFGVVAGTLFFLMFAAWVA